MNQNENLKTLILSLPNTCCYQITEEEPKKLILSGDVNIYSIGNNLFSCKLNQQIYETKTGDTILYKIDKYHYAIPNQGAFFGIKLSRNLSNETFTLLEDLVNQHTQLSSVNLDSDVIIDENIDEMNEETQESNNSCQLETNQEETKKKEYIREKDKILLMKEKETDITEKISDGINSTGEFIGQSLVNGASFLSNFAIQPFGNFLKKKIKEPEPEKEKKISEGTKENFKKAREFSEDLVQTSKEMTNTALDFSKTCYDNIVSFLDGGEKEEKKEEKNKEKETNNILKIAGSSISAVTKVIEGALDAGSILVNSSLESTTNVLEKKFGSDVGEVAKEISSSITNLVTTSNEFKKIQTRVIRTVILKERPKQLLKEFISQSNEQINEKEYEYKDEDEYEYEDEDQDQDEDEDEFEDDDFVNEKDEQNEENKEFVQIKLASDSEEEVIEDILI
ncbi:spartin [Anaeramoeba flamelloides]|uniref:Spartin n=1 Tax=Anaeramoeba flamelloides TaxID=1746091 RepID=A0AAV7YL75_9EUKA|nr:spartin [Anaeramoeba flamelloides]